MLVILNHSSAQKFTVSVLIAQPREKDMMSIDCFVMFIYLLEYILL
jgi:hypothetical protein